MAKLSNKTEALELINSNKVVIIDFFGSWCGPCQMFMPNFEEVSSQYEDIEFLKIDIDQDAEFASEQSVTGVPTIIAYKDGKEISRFDGFKSVDEFKEFVEEVK